MVLPWLLVGAAAALEGHRRGAPATESSAKVHRLQEVEKELRKKQKELTSQLQEAANVLGEERKAHAENKGRLQDMERIKSEIESRMSRLKDLTDELVTENAQLKVDNALLQDEAQRYRAENDELRCQAELLTKSNTDLKEKVQLLTESSEEEAARITGLLEDLKAEVAETLTAFTTGDLPALGFRDKMNSMGIKLDCNVEQLEAAQGSEPAREVLQDAVSSQFESQMGLVLEDKSRLTHLMSIAQNLRLPSSRSDASSYSHTSGPYDTARIAPGAGHASKQGSLNGGALPLGGGILRALAFNSESSSGEKDSTDEVIKPATSSIPSAAAPALQQHSVDAVAGQLHDMQVSGSSTGDGDEAPVTKAEPVGKGQAKKPKGLFSLRFKGLPEQKKNSGSMLGGSLTAGDLGADETTFSSVQVVPK